MTITEKHKIMDEISRVLDHFIVPEAPPTPKVDGIPEMLTIKECTEQFKGLSDKTVRQLIIRKEIPAIRTGQGKRGKFLIPKSALADYLKGA